MCINCLDYFNPCICSENLSIVSLHLWTCQQEQCSVEVQCNHLHIMLPDTTQQTGKPLGNKERHKAF